MEHLNHSIRNRFFESINQWFIHSSLLSMFEIQPIDPLATLFPPKELYQRIKYFLLWFPIILNTKLSTKQVPHIITSLLGPQGSGKSALAKRLILDTLVHDYDPIEENWFVFNCFIVIVFVSFCLYQYFAIIN